MKNELAHITFLQRCVAYNRDEQSYKQLFLHFYTSLHRLCMGIIKDDESAEEIVSDVMIKIWQMEEKLATIERLDLYLFQSVKNASLTYLSKPARQTVTVHEDAYLKNYATQDEADEKLLSKEIRQCIETAVARLPAQSQLVFRLVKDEGLPYKEVQQIMGISVNTIKTHIRIALKRIKDDLTSSNALKKEI